MMFQLAAIGIIGSLLVVAVGQQKKEMALGLSLAIGTLLLLSTSRLMGSLLQSLRSMAEGAGLGSEQWKLLLKLLAASYVIEFGSEVCKDAGQQAMAAKVQLGGRLLMAGLALPIFETLLTFIGDLLS